VVVSSILLLSKLKRTSPARSKFVPPLRFFFELLLLLLLLIGASGFYQERPHDKVAVLLDNSFSMAALSTEDLIETTLFSKAKAEVRWYLDRLRSQATVNLFTTSPHLQSVTKGFGSQSEALALLEEVNVVPAADQLEASLRRLVAQPEFQRILVVSDRRSGLGVLAGEQVTEPDPRVRFISLAPREKNYLRGNVAITDIGFSAVSEKTFQIHVSISSYAKEEIELDLMLSSISPRSPGEVKEVEKTAIKLRPGKTEKYSFIGRSFSDLAYQVSLKTSSGAEAKLDLLKEDNKAWIVPAHTRQRALLVGSLTPREIGLTKLPVARFSHLKPEQYLSEKQEGLNDLMVFHRFVPSRLPEVNSLFVFPPPGNELFELNPERSGDEITRWAQSKEIVKYLNVPSLSLPVIRPLKLPVWGEEVITTTGGPVLVAGEQNNYRYAVTGFELFPYLGKEAPVLSVLTLNLFKWLSSSGMQAGYQTVYSRLTSALSGKYVAQKTAGQKLIFEDPAGSGRKTALLPRSGLVQFASTGNDPFLAAVNYFNAQESNLIGTATVAVPAPIKGDRSGIEKFPFTSSLGFIVLTLLCLDTLILSGFFAGRRRE